MPEDERRPRGDFQEQLRAAPFVGRRADVVDGVVEPQPELDGIAIDQQATPPRRPGAGNPGCGRGCDSAGRARCTGGKARHRPSAPSGDGGEATRRRHRSAKRPASTSTPLIVRASTPAGLREATTGIEPGIMPERRRARLPARPAAAASATSTSRSAAARRAFPAFTRPLRSRITCSAQPGLSVSRRRKTSPAMRSARTGSFRADRGAARRVRDDAHLADQRVAAQHADDELARGRLADDFHVALDDDVGAVGRLAHAASGPRRDRTSRARLVNARSLSLAGSSPPKKGTFRSISAS